MDAFAGAITRGSNVATPQKSRLSALKVGLVFGAIEMIAPIIGYFLGMMAEEWISAYDHWLSFVLLGGLGVYLIYGAIADQGNKKTLVFDEDDCPQKKQRTVLHVCMTSNVSHRHKPPFLLTIFTAIATSIDAMIVGVTLAFIDVNIWLASLMIGTATTVMASVGVYLGARLSERIGVYAEIVGGVVLIGVGVFILLSHLGLIWTMT